MIRDVEGDILAALVRGRSDKGVSDVIAAIFGPGGHLLVHPAGSVSWRWKDGRAEILHLAGRWDPEAAKWMLARLPDPALWIWEGRRGWARFLRARGIAT